MKIQIDTVSKIIKVEERVNFNELIGEIQRLLPDTWQDYSIEGGWISYYPYYPPYLYHTPTTRYWDVTCGSSVDKPDVGPR